MSVLVTGAAGFIGMHVCLALLKAGAEVIGVDDMNAYYTPRLKEARLARLNARKGFTFMAGDIADRQAMEHIGRAHGASVSSVVHLAAQAGVRHSLADPFAYVQSNLVGHMVILELCRHHLPALTHLVYASSSSVYGGNEKVPFAVGDPVECPVSLYAATKRCDELLSQSYASLYGIPQTGLRFFTVYGPWGRPDMAYWRFAAAIRRNRPIRLYNQGRMRRDFTYVDDIVEGVLQALARPPTSLPVPHRLYNLGHADPVELRTFVRLLEAALGQSARIELAPMQPGDVETTMADIEATRRDLDWQPRTDLATGLDRFVAWFDAEAALTASVDADPA
ncbi:UDP-glucuronate 4-epimerase [Arboricoccus pini]|uniref:UDP-glucuronate 4-epimerase n=1 Tax=Arboricoccus pini TaxID=1963835 RepID=A0A212RWK6_9PROT|nr:SDR family NAD(P)-dependent oxidoreductase [Arboricoccus pini]SNB77169.1 UDP-glucuronate 4-epimerase [Arboricoccus pini]